MSVKTVTLSCAWFLFGFHAFGGDKIEANIFAAVILLMMFIGPEK